MKLHRVTVSTLKSHYSLRTSQAAPVYVNIMTFQVQDLRVTGSLQSKLPNGRCGHKKKVEEREFENLGSVLWKGYMSCLHMSFLWDM